MLTVARHRDRSNPSRSRYLQGASAWRMRPALAR
jgi:hypothetical protein